MFFSPFFACPLLQAVPQALLCLGSPCTSYTLWLFAFFSFRSESLVPNPLQENEPSPVAFSSLSQPVSFTALGQYIHASSGWFHS